MVGPKIKVHTPREPEHRCGHKAFSKRAAVLPILVSQVGPEVPVRQISKERNEQSDGTS